MNKPLKLVCARRLSHGLVAVLIAGFSVWQLSRPQGISWLFWGVQCLPLLILIPGMVTQRPRTYIWLCFLMLVYFVKGVDGVISPSRAWIDYLFLGISILLFICAMFTARWMHQHQNA